MNEMSKPPSGYALEKAMSIAQATCAGLAAEGVDTDDGELRLVLTDQGVDVDALVVRLLRAADEAKSMVELISARQDELAARKARFSASRETYRQAVLGIMEALPEVFPEGRFRCAEFTATTTPGKPRAILTGVSELPEAFWRTTRTPDMIAINTALKNDRTVPGVTLSNGGAVLTVRKS